MTGPWLELLAAKIVLSAGIVIGITVAAERLGPRIGGLLAATPQFSVIALVFFTIEQGHAFAAETAFWTIPGVCATVPFFLAYLAASGRHPRSRLGSIAVGILAGSVVFVAFTAVLGLVSLTRIAVIVVATLVCLAAGFAVRSLPDTAPLARVRTSPGLLAVRAAVSAAMVIAITAAANVLGPKWSGLVSGYPVNSLPIIAILHFHYGRETIRPIVKLWPAGAFGICLFNLTAWLANERLGLATTILLGFAVDIAYLMAVAWLRRRWR
jgi:hypothetical protein